MAKVRLEAGRDGALGLSFTLLVLDWTITVHFHLHSF